MGEEVKKVGGFGLFKLSDEQKKNLAEYMLLEQENTYYRTETVLDRENRKTGEVVEEISRVVTVGLPILPGHEIGDKVLISFGGYMEYQFDVMFVRRILNQLTEDSNRKFCIDAGNGMYVKNSEMIRIIKESTKAMQEKGITIVDDYSKDFRKTDMGKMLDGMGLI